MSTIDYQRFQDRADAQIRRWGAQAYLRRSGSDDRACWALEVQISAHERRALKNLNNRVFLISAKDLAVPPDKTDSLVLVDKVSGTKMNPLRQDAPVSPLQPEPGGVVVYYELQVSGNP